MLRLKNIDTYYGSSQVLFDVDLRIKPGQVVSMLGRNGMGKSTTVKSIMALAKVKQGDILFAGHSTLQKEPFEISQMGVAYVPENRRIFANLSVYENLVATARQANLDDDIEAWTLERVLDFFPALAPRLKQMGQTLSGGEQQMLAIGRALMLNPKLIILDEATEGLAPLIRQHIWQKLGELKQAGMSIFIIDKHIASLSKLADYHYIIEKGRIVWQGDSAALNADDKLTQKYIGIQ